MSNLHACFCNFVECTANTWLVLYISHVCLIPQSDTVEVTEHGSESDDGGTGKSGAADGGSGGEARLAGDNPGFPDFTPLHLACALAVEGAVEVVSKAQLTSEMESLL